MGINLPNAVKAALWRLIKRSAMRVNLQRMLYEKENLRNRIGAFGSFCRWFSPCPA
jgi:hypothetical protein